MGLKPGLEAYRNPSDQTNLWYKNDNTWNQVVSGGLILGALAVGEDFPDLKNNIIYNTIKNLVPSIDLYQRDGVWYEGFERGQYATSFLAMMLSSLNSSLEHDFGLSQRPGVDKTASYYVNSISPSGALYNYGDTDPSMPTLTSFLFWASKHYYKPEVAGFHKGLLKNRISAGTPSYMAERDRLFYLSLAWFDDSNSKANAKARAQAFRGPIDVLVLQGSARDGDGIYLAAKGGKATLGHQQLDAGSFVIDAQGERWGIELGTENPNLPGIKDDGAVGRRWNYYRNTNKSHNTLVIGDALQDPNGQSTITELNDADEQPFGIFDLTEAYKGTESMKRGFRLLSNDRMLVRDEINFEGNSQKVRWAMITDAKVELVGDKAILSKRGKRFFVQAFAEQSVRFEAEEAKAYHEKANSNSGKTVLFFELNSRSTLNGINISVVFGNDLSNLSKTMVDSKLDNWP